MMKRHFALPAALAAAITLAGCGSTTGTGSTMPTMDHSTSVAPSSAAGSSHNGADVMFAQMMVLHHSQAVKMGSILQAKSGVDPLVAALAGKIKAAQQPEIDTMASWLQAWGEPLEMEGSHPMAGMLDAAQLDQLAAAGGSDAGKLFLSQMVAHHEGAIDMAKEELASGKDAAALKLAHAVVADQEAEVIQMKDILGRLQ